MLPADNGHTRRPLFDGTAMDVDENDREIIAYKRGCEDTLAKIDAAEALEERRWRFAFAGLLASVVVAIGVVVVAIYGVAAERHADTEALLRAAMGGK